MHLIISNFNMDETGMSIDYKQNVKVMLVKEKKQVGKWTFTEREENVMIILCINVACNQSVPHLFVFFLDGLQDNLKKHKESVFYSHPSGWITIDSYMKWMKSFVARVHPTLENLVSLIMDGRSSHKQLEVILTAHSYNIHTEYPSTYSSLIAAIG